MTRARVLDVTLTDAEVVGSEGVAVQVPGLSWEPPLPPEVCRRAALTVCSHAFDVADARGLLDMLGLREAL